MEKNMKNVKVVGGFYNKTSAKKEIASQNRLAKQNGLEKPEIKVEDALHLYYSNPYFKEKIKEIGRPEAGMLIIVIYSKESNTITIPVVKQPIPTKVTKSTTLIKIPLKKTIISFISAQALKLKVILINLSIKNNTIIIRPLHKIIPLPTMLYPSLAA
jgi:hypothetical protein